MRSAIRAWRCVLPGLMLSALAIPAAAQCTCQADFDGSGFVDKEDYDAFVAAFIEGDQSADFDRTGFVDTDDFDAFACAFQTGCGLDFNKNGKVDCKDFDTYVEAFLAHAPLADFSCDGAIDGADFEDFAAQFQREILEFSCDNFIGCTDMTRFLVNFQAGNITTDVDCNGQVNGDDLNAYVEAWTKARVDRDGSGAINCGDFQIFGQQVLAGDYRADFDCDGDVDGDDVTTYAVEFHARCPSCGC